mgnify:CR=1 FL=1
MSKSFFTPAAWQGDKNTSAPRLPECGRCGLYKAGCLSPKMPPTGDGNRSVLFVAEAPGEREDRKGVQLVGKSGKLVREVLKSMPRKIRMRLEDGYKTNAVICRPPKNKIEDLYINSCRPNLLKTVRDTKPTVIILLGGSAVKGLLPTEREADVGAISRWVGWTIPSHEHGAWICPTYHPAYLLRMKDRVLDRLFRKHLRRALELENVPILSEPLEALKKRVEVILRPSEARSRLHDLSKKRGVLAFDYEANRLKPDDSRCKIVACSFCLDGEDTFAFPVTEELYPDISRVLKNPKLLKVASNLKNEERWTRAKLGHRVESWYWDTMLAAHFLDNRGGISSLKFQAFVQFGISDYDRVVAPYFERTDKDGFNAVEEIPQEELLIYNGLDSLLEYKLMKVQRKAAGFKS